MRIFVNDLCQIQKPKTAIIAPSAEAGDDAWKEPVGNLDYEKNAQKITQFKNASNNF